MFIPFDTSPEKWSELNVRISALWQPLTTKEGPTGSVHNGDEREPFAVSVGEKPLLDPLGF
jgi:hypothetical protein